MRATLFVVAAMMAASPSIGATVTNSYTVTVSSLLPPDRDASPNWKMAGLQSVGGIPNRTTVCATVNPLGSAQDDTTNIQKAIAACPAGEVVALGAGTFTIAEGNYVLLNKGITLRGAGPGVTTLQRTNGCPPLNPSSTGSCGTAATPIIIVGPERYNNNPVSSNLTADVAEGAYSVTVASTSGFSVGQIVLLDELSGASWQPDLTVAGEQIWAASDFRVEYNMHWPAESGDDPGNCTSSGCGAGGTGDAFSWFSRYDRVTNEHHVISAINGNTITFDSPTTISYRASHTAQLSYYHDGNTSNAGIENMTLSGADDGQLRFLWADNSWAYRVECTQWAGECIAVNYSFRIQLEQFYIHDGAWCEPGGAGYNISLAFGSSEILIQNGISVRCNKVMVSRSSGAGSVTAYNYMDDGYICCDGQPNSFDKWQEIGLNNSHMAGGHHMLFEGNQSFNMDSDDTHGNAIYNTYFRNWATGYRGAGTAQFTNPYDGVTINDLSNLPGGNAPLRVAGTHIYTYWDSFIGNVLGTSGQMSGWTYHATTFATNKAVFLLGYTDDQNYPSTTHDPMADFTFSTPPGTTVATGNYDYLTNAVSWDPTNSDHTLPNSLYLTSEPSFFIAGSGYAWPWVVPTGSPQILTGCAGKCSGLPAKARYDAGTPFTQP